MAPINWFPFESRAGQAHDKFKAQVAGASGPDVPWMSVEQAEHESRRLRAQYDKEIAQIQAEARVAIAAEREMVSYRMNNRLKTEVEAERLLLKDCSAGYVAALAARLDGLDFASLVSAHTVARDEAEKLMIRDLGGAVARKRGIPSVENRGESHAATQWSEIVTRKPSKELVAILQDGGVVDDCERHLPDLDVIETRKHLTDVYGLDATERTASEAEHITAGFRAR